MSNHTCPGPNCTNQVPSHMLACQAHWFQIPHHLRMQVWREYRKKPQSPAHLAACEAAVESIGGTWR